MSVCSCKNLDMVFVYIFIFLNYKLYSTNYSSVFKSPWLSARAAHRIGLLCGVIFLLCEYCHHVFRTPVQFADFDAS